MEYREEGVVHHDGHNYDLNAIFSLVANKSVQNYSVGLLVWLLDYDTPRQDRVQAADITYPIIVTRWQGRLLVIDGIHRLAKAHRLGYQTIPGRYVTKAELDSAMID